MIKNGGHKAKHNNLVQNK